MLIDDVVINMFILKNVKIVGCRTLFWRNGTRSSLLLCIWPTHTSNNTLNLHIATCPQWHCGPVQPAPPHKMYSHFQGQGLGPFKTVIHRNQMPNGGNR